jgi:hypothetical protein
MAYTAKRTPYGTYDIFQDGNRIGTGSASALKMYGLSENDVTETTSPSADFNTPNTSSNPNSSTGSTTPTPGNSDWDLTPEGSIEAGFIREAAGASGLVSQSWLDSVDPAVMTRYIAFYARALGDGGYNIGDVLNDLKRREIMATGPDEATKKAARDLTIISPEFNRGTYYSSAEGQAAKLSTSSIIPTFNLGGLGFDPEMLKYGINMPPDMFKMLVPLLDMDSEDFKKAVEDVKSAFYDIANQKLQAKSEQEKSVADYNYQKFKEGVERQYGIALSDDATKAWRQIEGLEESFAARGISGSGMEREAIDTTLRDTRKQDQRLRQDKLTQEEAQQASYYTSSATPEQIQALIDEDKAKGLPQEEWRATKWGLTPSADIIEKYSMENLRARYPNQSEEYLKSLRDEVLDQNGNYRSNIYARYYEGISENKASKKAMAETNVLQDAMNTEERTYRNLIDADAFASSSETDDKIIEDLAGGKQESTPPAPQSQTSPFTPDQQAVIKAGMAGGLSQEQSTNIALGKPGGNQTVPQQPAPQQPIANKVGVVPPQPTNYSGWTQQSKDAYQKALNLIPKQPVNTPQKPVVLSSSQQDEYFKSQDKAAKPMSPTDWYKQNYGS